MYLVRLVGIMEGGAQIIIVEITRSSLRLYPRNKEKG